MRWPTPPSKSREPLARRDAFLNSGLPPSFDGPIASALARVDRNMKMFGDRFPAPSSVEGIYPLVENVEWTSGFWTGTLWLAYELSGADRYRQAAEGQVESYARRIGHRINVDHHDLGFLYSLSCVAAARLTGNQAARDCAVSAADLLYARYLPRAGIIQAWGDLNDPSQAGRMIIDCNLNLPLLYWASEATGNAKYSEAANSHIAQAERYLVRPDASTYHTFFMDPQTGAPKEGRTHQGFSDSSCWARGQAWGIAGFTAVYRHKPHPSLIATAARLASYFLNRLPDDFVCNWDLSFTGPPEPRDSSAAAIAACGLLELVKHLPLTDPDRAAYEGAAIAIVKSLTDFYANPPDASGDGLLKHAVYHMPNRIGVDESCIWGDYFYLEALMRLTRVWETYW